MSELIKKKSMFNVDGNDDVNHRKIIKGNSTNLFNLNEVKYPWAKTLYRVMESNFWIPEKVDLTGDNKDYKNLTEKETKAFDGIISFLTFLDSVQTNNIPNIKNYITAPEVSSLLSLQEFQEVIHSRSYAYILESVVPSSKRNKVYELWRNDKVLLNRNKYIAGIYQDFSDNPTDENFARVLIANYVLESVYFYNGFIFFYNLSSRNTLLGVADEIRYIHRDEMTHVDLFSKIILAVNQEYPDFIKKDVVYSLFEEGVKEEIEWTTHIIGDGVLGMDRISTEQYTKFLANGSLERIGMEKLYPEVTENPYIHLEKQSDKSGDQVKSNFFESTVTSYSQSSAVDGWDNMFEGLGK